MTNGSISKAELSLFLIAMLLTGGMLYYLGASITGFVIKEFSYTDDLSLVVASGGNYTWQLKNAGELKSLKIEGRVTNYGKARVYLESNGIRYLIFDSTKLNETASIKNGSVSPITGFATKDTKENENKDPKEDKDKKKSNSKPKWVGDSKFVINGTAIINLSQYFIDEDKDALTYTSGLVSNITISINNELVVLAPNKEYFGNVSTAFTAFDGRNLTIQNVKLVIPEKTIGNKTDNATINNETISQNITKINQTINQSDQTVNQSINQTTNESIVKSINISLSYKSGSVYDANDNGEESINGVVDLTVEYTKLSWDADKTRLCTRWEVYNVEEGILTKFCNGNADCCAFFGLSPKNTNWSSIYYSAFNKDGAGYSNILSAQAVYYDVNLTSSSVKSEIYNSEWGNLSVKFFDDESRFSDICLDTCALSGLNKSSYTLIFEIENDAVLRIDKLKYSLLADVVNNPPLLLKNMSNVNVVKNKNVTINLSQYFADTDGDALAYSYYKADNLSMVFENNTATIVPDKEVEGIRFTYLIANDSEKYATSNLFMVNISDWQEQAANITTNITSNIASNGTFEIRNKEDNKLAVLDISGNLNIKGVLFYDIGPFADTNDFAIQNSSGGLNMVITNPEGNLLLKGSLFQNQSIISPTQNSFIIQSTAEETLAYVNSTGSLFLRGSLKENILFG